MPEKPSYLGLLNAIAVAETQAHEYLTAWIAVTPSAEVCAVLRTVAAREGEHGMAFGKRINELGFDVRKKAEDERHAKALAIAGSDRSDLEKMEALGLGRLDRGAEPDVFDDFFKDHTIDIRTGELLGRYIAEERDTGRLLRSCYEQLKAAADAPPASRGRRRRSAGSARRQDRCRLRGGRRTAAGRVRAGGARERIELEEAGTRQGVISTEASDGVRIVRMAGDANLFDDRLPRRPERGARRASSTTTRRRRSCSPAPASTSPTGSISSSSVGSRDRS